MIRHAAILLLMVLSQADPTPVFLVAGAIFAGAPHPNAAKLFLDWYLAPDQQRRLLGPLRRAAAAGLKPLSAYNLDRSFRALHSDPDQLAALKRRFAGYVEGK